MEINQSASAFANISPFGGQQAKVIQEQQRQQANQTESATANPGAASPADTAQLRTDQTNPLDDQGRQTASGVGTVNDSTESEDAAAGQQRGTIVDVSV